jgi:hypothetical protein
MPLIIQKRLTHYFAFSSLRQASNFLSRLLRQNSVRPEFFRLAKRNPERFEVRRNAHPIS